MLLPPKAESRKALKDLHDTQDITGLLNLTWIVDGRRKWELRLQRLWSSWALVFYFGLAGDPWHIIVAAPSLTPQPNCRI